MLVVSVIPPDRSRCERYKHGRDEMIVYDGGRQLHHSSAFVYAYVKELDADNNSAIVSGGRIADIPDSVAQTIAAMWHSPKGESTYLSTMGKVTAEMTMADFCTEREYAELDTSDTLLIDYLRSYIESKQA